jgi:hypothetical protein
MRSSACFPRILVIKGRAIQISIYTFQTSVNKKMRPLRKNILELPGGIEKRQVQSGLETRKKLTLHCWDRKMNHFA